MTNAQILKDRIKSRCKNQGKEVTTMLENLSLGVNAVNQINEKKGMGVFALASIADYLDCSVDYLLGRTDVPTANSNSIIKTGDIKGDNSANNSFNISTSLNNTVDEQQQEINKMLSDMSPRERNKLMSMIYDYYDECKKGNGLS